MNKFEHAEVSIGGVRIEGIERISYERKPELVAAPSGSYFYSATLDMTESSRDRFLHCIDIATLGRYWVRRREWMRRRANNSARR